VAIAECALAGGRGVEVVLPGPGRADAVLFGEAPSRFILTARAEAAAPLAALAAAHGVRIIQAGRTGGSRIRIRAAPDGAAPSTRETWDIDVSVEEAAAACDALEGVFA
jgi:phosphoribosylformylglycinamidine synthase